MKFSHYILLEMARNNFVSVQPENDDAFIAELEKRQKNIERIYD